MRTSGNFVVSSDQFKILARQNILQIYTSQCGRVRSIGHIVAVSCSQCNRKRRWKHMQSTAGYMYALRLAQHFGQWSRHQFYLFDLLPHYAWNGQEVNDHTNLTSFIHMDSISTIISRSWILMNECKPSSSILSIFKIFSSSQIV